MGMGRTSNNPESKDTRQEDINILDEVLAIMKKRLEVTIEMTAPMYSLSIPQGLPEPLLTVLRDRAGQASTTWLQTIHEMKHYQFGDQRRPGIGKGTQWVDDWTTITVEQPLLVDSGVTIRHKM